MEKKWAVQFQSDLDVTSLPTCWPLFRNVLFRLSALSQMFRGNVSSVGNAISTTDTAALLPLRNHSLLELATLFGLSTRFNLPELQMTEGARTGTPGTALEPSHFPQHDLMSKRLWRAAAKPSPGSRGNLPGRGRVWLCCSLLPFLTHHLGQRPSLA